MYYRRGHRSSCRFIDQKIVNGCPKHRFLCGPEVHLECERWRHSNYVIKLMYIRPSCDSQSTFVVALLSSSFCVISRYLNNYALLGRTRPYKIWLRPTACSCSCLLFSNWDFWLLRYRKIWRSGVLEIQAESKYATCMRLWLITVDRTHEAAACVVAVAAAAAAAAAAGLWQQNA